MTENEIWTPFFQNARLFLPFARRTPEPPEKAELLWNGLPARTIRLRKSLSPLFRQTFGSELLPTLLVPECVPKHRKPSTTTQMTSQTDH